MGNVDGFIFILVGCYFLTEPLDNKFFHVSIILLMILVVIFMLICVLYRKFKMR